MKLSFRSIAMIGGSATALLAIGALIFKASVQIQLPARVDKLESTQVEMAKRIDAMSFDVQRMRLGQEESDRRAGDWQQRMSTVMSELSGSMRSLRDSVEIQARESIRTSEQVKNLQVITDQLTEHHTKP